MLSFDSALADSNLSVYDSYISYCVKGLFMEESIALDLVGKLDYLQSIDSKLDVIKGILEVEETEPITEPETEEMSSFANDVLETLHSIDKNLKKLNNPEKETFSESEQFKDVYLTQSKLYNSLSIAEILLLSLIFGAVIARIFFRRL